MENKHLGCSKNPNSRYFIQRVLG